MQDEPRRVESRLAELERRVRALELAAPKLARYEQDSVTDDDIASVLDAAPTGFDPIAILTLVGRTCLVLGGAYLLRALTDARTLPTPVGVSLGFAYAATWLGLACVRTSTSRWTSSLFHGATALLIALPLLWEATTRFALLGGTAAAAALVAIVVVTIAAAVRTDIQTLAWLVVCGSMAESIALMAATGFTMPFVVADIAIGITTLWVGYAFDWIWLRWLPALIADLAVLALIPGAGSGLAQASEIIAVQLLLLTAYLTSIAIRTLVRGREVNLFEVVQGTAALASGFGGAVYVAQSSGSGGTLLSAIGAASGAACYAIAFAFVARRQGLRRNFYFYTSTGLVLVIAATATAMPAAPMLWALLAVPAAWSSRRAGHFTLSLHAAIYIVAAAIGSGLLASAAAALAGDITHAPLFSPLHLSIVGAALVCWAAPPFSGPDRFVPLPRAAIAVVVALWAAGAIVVGLETMQIDPGFIATARTAALAAVTLALAALSRTDRFKEASWLVYPMLVAGGLKLIVEDLPRAQPSTMFVGLAVYGFALIAAPRLAARPKAATPPAVPA